MRVAVRCVEGALKDGLGNDAGKIRAARIVLDASRGLELTALTLTEAGRAGTLDAVLRRPNRRHVSENLVRGFWAIPTQNTGGGARRKRTTPYGLRSTLITVWLLKARPG